MKSPRQAVLIALKQSLTTFPGMINTISYILHYNGFKGNQRFSTFPGILLMHQCLVLFFAA